jgi:hypothetical protein
MYSLCDAGVSPMVRLPLAGPAKMGWSGHPLWPRWGGQPLIYFIFILNNILLLFFVSGTSVPFVAVGFLRKNHSHELDIL